MKHIVCYSGGHSSALVVTNNFTRVISRRKELRLKDTDKQ
jgi:hypothetical protein